jgi:predicted GIY-YIG superfamily endonuclease
MHAIFEKITSRVNEIEESKKIDFETLKADTISGKTEGVYIIRKKDSHRVLYVGRTTDMSSRLYTNHLQGNESTARLKKYLSEDEKLSCYKNFAEAKNWLKKNCYVQYIEESDYRTRGKIEGLFSFYFDVEYIHSER